MARRFEKGIDKPGDPKHGVAGEFGISEARPMPIGTWVNRVVVYGDEKLRDRIVALLMAHGAGE